MHFGHFGVESVPDTLSGKDRVSPQSAFFILSALTYKINSETTIKKKEMGLLLKNLEFQGSIAYKQITGYEVLILSHPVLDKVFGPVLILL